MYPKPEKGTPFGGTLRDLKCIVIYSRLLWSYWSTPFTVVACSSIFAEEENIVGVPGGVGHGPRGIMGKKSKTAYLHLTFPLFTSLVTP